MQFEEPLISYFQNYWKAAVTTDRAYGEVIHTFNLRVIIRELVDELTSNPIKNGENISFFIKKIGVYYKNDKAIKKTVRSDLKSLLKEATLLEVRPDYILAICCRIANYFKSREYIKDCSDYLAGILSLDDTLELRRDIRVIIESLVVEFREVGYADADIKDFGDRIFSICLLENIKSWDFSDPIIDRFQNILDKSKAKNEFVEYQEELPLTTRLNLLVDLSNKENCPTIYIFSIHGISCAETLSIDGVTIYNPHQEKRLPEKYAHAGFDETFRRAPGKDCVNAMVVQDALTPGGGMIHARSRVQFALTCFVSAFFGRVSIRISLSYGAFSETSTFNILNTWEDANDNPSNLYTVDPRTSKTGKEKIESITDAVKKADSNGWGIALRETLSWVRKGQAASEDVDRLMNYWISIENLFKKSDLSNSNWFETTKGKKEYVIEVIKNVLSKHYALSEVYRSAWNIHRYFATPSIFAEQRIPHSLKVAAGIDNNPVGTVYLKDFISHLAELKPYAENQMVLEQIDKTLKFYSDPKFAKEVLQERLAYAQDEILLLYRMRNKIAHDGSTQSPSLPILARTAKGYAFSLLDYVIHACLREWSQPGLSRLLISRAQEYDQTIELLDSETVEAVFL